MTEHDPAHADDGISSLVRAAAPTRFASGFRDRVGNRIDAEREESLSHALERQFIRVVPFVAAASVLLAAYNWWGARGSTVSPIDAALNLPQVTLSSAYSASSLFGTVAESPELP